MSKTKSKPSPPQVCNCLQLADEQLRKNHGAKFKTSLAFNSSTNQVGIAGPFLAIEWEAVTRSNRKLPTIECAFCPFCGKEKPE